MAAAQAASFWRPLGGDGGCKETGGECSPPREEDSSGCKVRAPHQRSKVRKFSTSKQSLFPTWKALWCVYIWTVMSVIRVQLSNQKSMDCATRAGVS